MCYTMDDFLSKYDTYDKTIVYDFKLGYGGIGDCIKFFIFLLQTCIRNHTRLYYKINNIPIEKYLKLKHETMYITHEQMMKYSETKNIEVIVPHSLYSLENEIYNTSIKIDDVFVFSDEVLSNINHIIPRNLTNYISIHLRLGDKFLETDPAFVQCKHDVRSFNPSHIIEFIKKHNDKQILFFCDNFGYKLCMKHMFDNIVITNCKIGHTGLANTTEPEVLNAVTEFCLLTNSDLIASASNSGFSIVASKFKNVPHVCLFR